MKPSKKQTQWLGGYGNNASYLCARLKRDRPDIAKDLLDGKYKSFRSAAIEAGIITAPPHIEDRSLDKLVSAWRSADLESRQVFLSMFDDEIDAAQNGELLNVVPIRRGNNATYKPIVVIQEIEELLDNGATVGDVAKLIGVSVRTIQAWRSGKTKPDQTKIDLINKNISH